MIRPFSALILQVCIELKLIMCFIGALRTKGPVVQYTSDNSAAAAAGDVGAATPATPTRPVAPQPAGPPQPSRTESVLEEHLFFHNATFSDPGQVLKHVNLLFHHCRSPSLKSQMAKKSTGQLVLQPRQGMSSDLQPKPLINALHQTNTSRLVTIFNSIQYFLFLLLFYQQTSLQSISEL